MKKIVSVLAILALLGGFASAQTLTSDGEMTNATSITPTLGYVLYAFHNAPGLDGQGFGETNELPSFITGESPGGSSSNEYRGNHTSITVDGTTYQTGQITTQGLADTMTLGNVIPSSFVLGTMINTQNPPGVGTSTQITIDLYNFNNVLLSQVVDGTAGGDGTSPDANDIYYTTITGAQDGDYLTFSLAAGGNGPSLSAITFDSSDPLSIPEPKTWALLFGGVAFLGFTVLRRRQQV